MRVYAIIACLCFFLMPYALIGQSRHDLEYLLIKLQTTEGQEKVKVLLEIGWEYKDKSPDKAIVYFHEALKITQSEEDKLLLPKVYNYLGVAYAIQSDYLKAIDFHRKAEQLGKLINDSSQVAHSYNSIGRIHYRQTNFAIAYTYFYQALAIFEKLGDDDGMGYCYQSLSRILQSQQKLTEAADMSKKALAIREHLQNISGQISVRIELSNILKESGKLKEAQDALAIAQHQAHSSGDSLRIAEIFLAKSEIYFLQEEFSTALDYTELALQVVNKTTNYQLLHSAEMLLGKIYFKQNTYGKAQIFLQKTLASTEKSNDIALKAEAVYYLSLLEEQKGNFKTALRYSKRMNSLQDSIMDLDKMKQIGKVEGRMELVKKEQENLYLKDNEIKNLELIKKQQERNIALVGVALLLIGVLVVIFLRSQKTERLYSLFKKQKEKTDEQMTAIRESNQELEELNKEKDAILGIVAHDLKSPLNRIKGYTQIMKLLGGLNEEQAQNIQGIEQAVENGSNLIRDILDVSYYEHSEYQTNIESIDLNEFMENEANQFTLMAQKKEIDLHIVGKSIDTVETDTSVLTRVLENLLSNAIKFSPSGKNVWLDWGERKDKFFIKVKDEGPGFSHADQKKVFKKFTQLSAKPTAGEHSTGLGLAIVKTLLERLNGTIKLESQEGRGAEFICWLPKKIKK